MHSSLGRVPWSVLRVLATRRWLGALALARGVRRGVRSSSAGGSGTGTRPRSSGPTGSQPLRRRPGAARRRWAAPEPMPVRVEWTRVTATGSVCRGRAAAGAKPPERGRLRLRGAQCRFVLPDGRALLVDRGWVHNAESAADAARGAAEARGRGDRHRLAAPVGEPSLGHQLPAGQLASINLPRGTRPRPGPTCYGTYVVLDREQTAAGPAPRAAAPAGAPDTGLGPHQAYAVPVVGLDGPVGFVLVFFGVRREWREGPGGRRRAAARRARPRQEGAHLGRGGRLGR